MGTSVISPWLVTGYPASFGATKKEDTIVDVIARFGATHKSKFEPLEF